MVECDKGKQYQVADPSRLIIALQSQTVAMLWSCKNLAQSPM